MDFFCVVTHKEVVRDHVADDLVRLFGGENLKRLGNDAVEFLVKKPFTRDINQVTKNLALDVNFVPRKRRNKRLLVADMDETIITDESIDQLAEMVGRGEEIRFVTSQAMNGKIDFESAVCDRVKLLSGTPEHILEKCFLEKISYSPGARTLIATMRARGACTALVSGGFTFFSSRVALDLGIDFHFGNQLIFKDGLLTGDLEKPILGSNQKLSILEKLSLDLKILKNDVIAVGDGANDISIIKGAGLGVAYYAKPIVKSASNLQINYSDLRALLYLQGISCSEFVKA